MIASIPASSTSCPTHFGHRLVQRGADLLLLRSRHRPGGVPPPLGFPPQFAQPQRLLPRAIGSSVAVNEKTDRSGSGMVLWKSWPPSPNTPGSGAARSACR